MRAVRLLLFGTVLGIASTTAVGWVCSRLRLDAPQIWYSVRPRTPAEGGGFLVAVLYRKAGLSQWSALAAPEDPLFQNVGAGPPPESLVPSSVRPLLFPWLDGGSPWPGQTTRVFSDVQAFGWPWPALAASYLGERGKLVWSGVASVPWLQRSAASVPGLPIGVLPTGFAADTLVYTVAWWGMLSAPSVVRLTRRRFRVSRGMCGSCGYDLRGSPGGTCSECGAGAKA